MGGSERTASRSSSSCGRSSAATDSRELVLQLYFVRPASERPIAAPGGVLRNAEEPGSWLLWRVAAPESPVGIEKRILGDLLRVRSVTDVAKDVAVDLGKMPPVEALERAIVETPPQRLNAGAHGRSVPKNPKFLTFIGYRLRLQACGTSS